MKLVWSPEIAAKAFMDTVKSVTTLITPSSLLLYIHMLQLHHIIFHWISNHLQVSFKQLELFEGSSAAELISAMAAGWNAKLIVETWSHGGVTTTSIGLSVASMHTCGKHVCIAPDEDSKAEYVSAMKKAGMSPEVIVGEPEEVVKGMIIDFLVVDSGKKNRLGRIIKEAKFGDRGAVVVCKNASLKTEDFRLGSLFDGGSRRIVRSVFLPVGKGLDIAHVAAGEVGSGSGLVKKSRWIRRVDKQSGEEFVIRK